MTLHFASTAAPHLPFLLLELQNGTLAHLDRTFQGHLPPTFIYLFIYSGHEHFYRAGEAVLNWIRCREDGVFLFCFWSGHFFYKRRRRIDTKLNLSLMLGWPSPNVYLFMMYLSSGKGV